MIRAVLLILAVVTLALAQRFFMISATARSTPVGPALVTTGIVWGSDFTQGADAQVLYGVIDGGTISASNGIVGATTGSEASDPTWSVRGADLDGGDYFITIGAASLWDFIAGDWTYHVRIKVVGDGYVILWNNATAFASGGGGYLYYSNTLDTPHQIVLKYPTYSVAAQTSGSDLRGAWHTLSVTYKYSTRVMRVYLDGSFVDGGDQTTGGDPTTNSHSMDLFIRDFSGPIISTSLNVRIVTFHNVVHDATECAAQHEYFESLAIT